MGKTVRHFLVSFFWSVLAVHVVGCGSEHSPSLSLLPDANVFQQSPSVLNNKIDILWVIDNSGSMAPYQANLTSNFNYFINSFVTKGYDFKVGVTTSDAFKFNFGGNEATYARFKDGLGANHTGVYVITPSTASIATTFSTNATQGTTGSGDERAFSSFKTALNSGMNAGFHRPDAYLAVIILSDEDDFSTNVSYYTNADYNYSGLFTVQSFVDYLNGFTGTSGSTRRFSVSAIGVFSDACLAATAATGSRKGLRYQDIIGLTGGVQGDICAPSYATVLDQLQSNIAELSTQFFLNRVPIPATIVVHVNGTLVPEDAVNGWTFHADSNSIRFHGTSIPAQSSVIVVDFDPVTIK